MHFNYRSNAFPTIQHKPHHTRRRIGGVCFFLGSGSAQLRIHQAQALGYVRTTLEGSHWESSGKQSRPGAMRETLLSSPEWDFFFGQLWSFLLMLLFPQTIINGHFWQILGLFKWFNWVWIDNDHVINNERGLWKLNRYLRNSNNNCCFLILLIKKQHFF